MIFINEKVLEDNYPVYGNYLYVCDGKVIKCDIVTGTVADLKKDLMDYYKLSAKEIRSCDIANRKKLHQLNLIGLKELKNNLTQKYIGEFNKPDCYRYTLDVINELIDELPF